MTNPCPRCVWLRRCLGNYCGWRTKTGVAAKRHAWLKKQGKTKRD